MVVINMDDLNVWIQACEKQATLFRCVMPMAIEKLAIAQHWDRLRYAIICGSGYRLRIWRFEWGDYVYLQQMTLTILDVIVGRVILHVWKGFPFKNVIGEPRWLDMEKPCA